MMTFWSVNSSAFFVFFVYKEGNTSVQSLFKFVVTVDLNFKHWMWTSDLESELNSIYHNLFPHPSTTHQLQIIYKVFCISVQISIRHWPAGVVIDKESQHPQVIAWCQQSEPSHLSKKPLLPSDWPLGSMQSYIPPSDIKYYGQN